MKRTPAGGWNDFYSFALTKEDAICIYKESLTQGTMPGENWNGEDLENQPRDWAQIVCLTTGGIVENDTILTIAKEAKDAKKGPARKLSGWEKY